MASRSRPPPGLTRGCGFLLPPAPPSRRLPLLRARAPHCLPEALLAPGPPYPPPPPRVKLTSEQHVPLSSTFLAKL